MADDLYGGYAPATLFLNNQEVYLQTETDAKKHRFFCAYFSPSGLKVCSLNAMQFPPMRFATLWERIALTYISS